MRLEIYGATNLNFVEFNITGDGESIQRCDKDSLYMDSELFSLFSECFENSNNLYDYFGPTKYNARNIIVQLNALKKIMDTDLVKLNTLIREKALPVIGLKKE